MKLHRFSTVVGLASLLTLCVAGHGMRYVEPEPPDPDRVLFDRLADDVGRLEMQARQLSRSALRQARGEYGHVDMETKARLLSLRDRRDSLHARMLILSSRHGWVVPQLKRLPVKVTSVQESVDSVFGSIDVLVRRQLTDEALQIVERVHLPVVSMDIR